MSSASSTSGGCRRAAASLVKSKLEMGIILPSKIAEHAQLAESLGVDQLAVVITKLDTCDYDEQRFQHLLLDEKSHRRRRS